MRNLIFLSGINGSGKSTIAKRLSEKTDIPFFEGSKILMKHFGLAAGDYDALRAIPLEDQLKGNVAALKQISQEHEKAIAIGHFMLTIKGTTQPFLGDWFNDCLCLIHLWNDPDVILKRIEDDERDRKLFSQLNASLDEKIKFIKETQEKSIECAKQISEQYGIPLIMIKNDLIEDSVNQIIENIL
ncbi:MAG: hypothetical protein JWM20_146 [Patescibacteria group bacterium]|nr:hypothetical protein [Patescibacteria group bacterium]